MSATVWNCQTLAMIKRISETWKQQKDEVTRRNRPKLKKPSQSLVTRSVTGSSNISYKSTPIHEENELPEECIISPPQRLTRNRKKKKDITVHRNFLLYFSLFSLYYLLNSKIILVRLSVLSDVLIGNYRNLWSFFHVSE